MVFGVWLATDSAQYLAGDITPKRGTDQQANTELGAVDAAHHDATSIAKGAGTRSRRSG